MLGHAVAYRKHCITELNVQAANEGSHDMMQARLAVKRIRNVLLKVLLQTTAKKRQVHANNSCDSTPFLQEPIKRGRRSI